MSTALTTPDVRRALGGVLDPEIRRPITELGMVGDVVLTQDAGACRVAVTVLLTTSACPLRERLTADVRAALEDLPGVGPDDVGVTLGVMDDEQRSQLLLQLRGGVPEKVVPFAQPGNLTRVVLVASGKGGVGKSTLAVNLAAALAASGRSVGLLDADVHGHSVPPMMGIDRAPVRLGAVVIPPVAHGVKVISMGMFSPPDQPVVQRGPLLHRSLEQLLTGVHFGDLDVLLVDMPPGTGDVAITLSQLVPGAGVLVVTPPARAAAAVAVRAGTMAQRTASPVVGVVENMSWWVAPDGSRTEPFGSGGGASVAAALSASAGSPVPLLGQVPMDPALREGGDAGTPLVLSDPGSPAAAALLEVAGVLSARPRGLAGRRLRLSPTGAG